MKTARRVFCLVVLLAVSAGAQFTYQKPPQAILDVLNAPPTPQGSLNPTRTHMLLMQGVRYPAIADLSQPMLRLAGLRINPRTNGPHMPPRIVSYTLKKLPDGGPTSAKPGQTWGTSSEIAIKLPPNVYLSSPSWSPDGTRFAFTNTTQAGIELWIGDTTGKVAKAPGIAINAAAGGGGGRFGGGGAFDWLNNRTLIVRLVPAGRGAPPAEPSVPMGPNVQESAGKSVGVATFEDMLKDHHDEALLEYYATAQLALFDTTTMKATPVGKPAIFTSADASPDGRLILIERVHRPFSYLHPLSMFPKEVEVWDHAGKVVYTVVSRGLEDRIPMEGVVTGPRSYQWRPTEPATLYWIEALDEGNPKNKAPFRDRLMTLKAPFTAPPTEVTKTEQRMQRLQWGEKFVLVTDFERNRRWTRTFILDPDQPGALKLLWERNNQNRYQDPGSPVMRTLANGQRVIHQDGDSIFLTGQGASRQGDRPFLNRYNLKTGATEPIFRCGDVGYESVTALLSDDGSKFLTQHESPTEPPNYFLRTADGKAVAFTNFPDRAPQLRQIKKQLVTYKREDGVGLSFTLYLPPDYKEGTRLPTIVWAYPYEYSDADTASQISGSTQRFTQISGISQLFLVLAGYAVLDGAAMPVIGDSPETVNDTYVKQIVMDAKAAIDKAVEMGVTDRDRVGVGGHSYGAFMTANLLAHSDLFRAGCARSGAYNRTLTPFGFQSERRTFWEARDTYLTMSPFLFADKIKAPILLIHGEADNNSGTFPIQSERMFQAIRGNGGTVRLVFLPFESHGYSARESTEHTLWEMITWFDKWVKNAAPRGTEQKTAN